MTAAKRTESASLGSLQGTSTTTSRGPQTFFQRLSPAPPDFFLFPKMKIMLKGRRSDTVVELPSRNADSTKHLNKETLPGCISKVA
jgi:hypothetical protein